jgi:pimeloyl-ACP methyl ester carboxylesterase
MVVEPHLCSVQCLSARGLHRMAYWEWPASAAPAPAAAANTRHAVVCVHGLTRQGRDFDSLARHLAPHARVICPDIVGRGRSDWLSDPMAYAIPSYVADILTLLARLDVDTVDWVGTSMGGLIGMALASMKGSPIRRLVLNDVGPRIEPQSLQRIGSYVGQGGRWPTLQAAADAIWAISAGFGPHTPAQWLALTEPLLRQESDGHWVLRYDPAIAQPLRAITPELAAGGEALLWMAYDSLRCPTLLLRGEHSDLLSPETAVAMTQRGPRARLHTVAGVGHAPTLVDAGQCAVVSEFLLAP